MQAKPGIYLGLLHYPMYNKNQEIITTSVTNLDLHDIARVARTYGLEGFFVVHPAASQRELLARILDFWQKGYGGLYNPDRCEAFNRVAISSSLEGVIASIEEREGLRPLTVATDARPYPQSLGYACLKEQLKNRERPYLLLFGTGWGMAGELVRGCDYILHPVALQSDYNHLSVRSAVAIIIDRLMGEEWF